MSETIPEIEINDAVANPVQRFVMCRASTLLLAGKMLRQLAEYGAPEIAKPMNDTASEILQAVTEQCSIEDIDKSIAEAQCREGT